MIIGQDYFEAIQSLDCYGCEKPPSPVAVRLPLGSTLSAPLPVNQPSFSSCYKVLVSDEFDLSRQVKVCYDMESFGATFIRGLLPKQGPCLSSKTPRLTMAKDIQWEWYGPTTTVSYRIIFIPLLLNSNQWRDNLTKTLS